MIKKPPKYFSKLFFSDKNLYTFSSHTFSNIQTFAVLNTLFKQRKNIFKLISSLKVKNLDGFLCNFIVSWVLLFLNVYFNTI